MSRPALPPARLATIAATALLLAACGSTPPMPTVVDSQRRPVNAPGAIDLQVCRAELQAARLLIAEAPLATCPARSSDRMLASDSPDTRLAVLTFERGQARVDLDATTLDTLREAAQRASRIDVHARGDQAQDTPADTALARRRAQAAAELLTQRLGVQAERIRVSWTGATEAALPAEQRRRVEIAFAERPVQVLVTRAAAPVATAAAAIPPAPTTTAPRPPVRPTGGDAAERPAAAPAAPPKPAMGPAPSATSPVALQVRQPG